MKSFLSFLVLCLVMAMSVDATLPTIVSDTRAVGAALQPYNCTQNPDTTWECNSRNRRNINTIFNAQPGVFSLDSSTGIVTMSSALGGNANVACIGRVDSVALAHVLTIVDASTGVAVHTDMEAGPGQYALLQYIRNVPALGSWSFYILHYVNSGGSPGSFGTPYDYTQGISDLPAPVDGVETFQCHLSVL